MRSIVPIPLPTDAKARASTPSSRRSSTSTRSRGGSRRGWPARYGLTGPQLTVIKLLETFGDLSLSSLSERIRAQNSTVTGIIDRMEREGLVLRERSTPIGGSSTSG
jgi:hypothetical protein